MLWTSVLLSFLDRVFNMVLDSFWEPFGEPYGGQFWPFWVLKLPQVRSKTPLATHFLTKSDFSNMNFAIMPMLMECSKISNAYISRHKDMIFSNISC